MISCDMMIHDDFLVSSTYKKLQSVGMKFTILSCNVFQIYYGNLKLLYKDYIKLLKCQMCSSKGSNKVGCVIIYIRLSARKHSSTRYKVLYLIHIWNQSSSAIKTNNFPITSGYDKTNNIRIKSLKTPWQTPYTVWMSDCM